MLTTISCLRDASKVPPSQFQKRKGSIFATPGGRDGHVKGAERDKAFHDKVKEKVKQICMPMLCYGDRPFI